MFTLINFGNNIVNFCFKPLSLGLILDLLLFKLPLIYQVVLFQYFDLNYHHQSVYVILPTYYCHVRMQNPGSIWLDSPPFTSPTCFFITLSAFSRIHLLSAASQQFTHLDTPPAPLLTTWSRSHVCRIHSHATVVTCFCLFCYLLEILN